MLTILFCFKDFCFVIILKFFKLLIIYQKLYPFYQVSINLIINNNYQNPKKFNFYLLIFWSIILS